MSNAVALAPARTLDRHRARPSSVHHVGWQVADQERNRQFFEDILGIPLVAAFSDESTVNPGLKFSHTLYELGDGNSLAFFQMLGDAAQFDAGSGNRFNHIALRADAATQQAAHERLVAANYEHFIQDHGWTISLYVTSPDGINVEFAVDTPLAEEVLARRRVDPHGDLANWMAGDHRSNSDEIANPEPVKRYPAR